MSRAARSPKTAQNTLLLVLAAEAALFGTLIMSYLYLRAGGASTPFAHAGPGDFVIASTNTLVLLASAAFANGALRAIERGRVKRLETGLTTTMLLGTVFVVGQVIELSHSGMQIDDSAFGGALFALISFHAAHVVAGMTLLGLALARARLGDFGARRHVAVTTGIWFWYFVVAVWIILFCVLYLV